MTNSYYIERINKVIDYIEENIEQKLTLVQLSNIAMFSKYHFHRIFKSVTGETLNGFIKRVRMTKAYRLLQVDQTMEINELAFTLGYNSTANFSRDFKDFYGFTPSEIKESDNILVERVMKINSSELNITYKGIEKIPDKFLLYKKITTGYNTKTISKAFEDLHQIAVQNEFLLDQFIGIGYDDPDYTSFDKCKYDACMAVNPENVPKELSINSKILREAHYAIFYFEGHEKQVSLAWDYIFKEWLLNSNYIPDNRPHLEMYLYSEQYELRVFKVNLCLPIKLIKK